MDFDALFAKKNTHIKPGLERIQAAYEKLGRPAARIPAVLIGGTNGKGSTSAFLWSLLSCQSSNIGLYTSPHLVNFSERFQMSQTPCSNQDLIKLLEEMKGKLGEAIYQELSFFELATLMAFSLFEQRKVSVQILEVGLGGRWDATNISQPLISAVVSLSRDHQEYLGSDLRQIFREKLGIVRAGCPLFWGKSGEILAVEEHQQILQQTVTEQNLSLREAGADFAYDAKLKQICLRRPSGEIVVLPLYGVFSMMPLFLRHNLALAAAMYDELQRSRPELGLMDIAANWSKFSLAQSPAPVTLIGRSQRISISTPSGNLPLLIDVAHNPDGVKTLLAGLASRSMKFPVPGLVCILRDKDTNGILDVLRQSISPLILFGLDHERGPSAELLAERHRDLRFFSGFEQAFAYVKQSWKPTDGPWVVCGSVLAVGHVLASLGLVPGPHLTLEQVIQGDW